MVNYQGKVFEFMEKHDQYRRIAPFGIIPDDVRLLRMRLIAEEYGELCSAIHNGDLTETADAVCDLLYVVYGTGVAAGITLCPDASRGPVRLPGFPALDVAMTMMHQIASSLERTFSLLSLSRHDAEYYRSLRYALENLVVSVEDLGCQFGLPVGELFSEVHRSNMTKGKLGTNNKGGKVGKSSTFEPPKLGEILRNVQIV